MGMRNLSFLPIVKDNKRSEHEEKTKIPISIDLVINMLLTPTSIVLSSSRRLTAVYCHRRLLSTDWRKSQLDKLEQKFAPTIESDDQVQPMWKDMESRVTKRRPMTVEERKGISGRRNVRKTDEDSWLEAGLYEDNENEERKQANDKT